MVIIIVYYLPTDIDYSNSIFFLYIISIIYIIIITICTLHI
jgi:hypothetical protein